MPWKRRVIALALLASIAPTTFGRDADEAEARPEPPDKVSNDDPGRPLQMPPATTEVKEALEDFERFRKRGAWERALKALYSINDDQALRFVDGSDGFIIPVARKRREVLTALPPEGQAAYRLFYDAEARKLFEQAQGDAEQANLERIYSAYFTTTVGAAAADRLGDLDFEQGRFDRAADCWLSILRDRPDADVPAATVAVKAAIALFRAGRRSEFDQLRAEIEDRHRDEPTTLGGETATPPEWLRRLVDAPAPDTAASEGSERKDGQSDAPLELADPATPAWQFRIADSIEAGMGPVELNQWRSSPLNSARPAAAVDGKTLYLNYLGRILAIDLESGRLRWRTESFHQVEQLSSQPAGQMLDPTRFAILARGERLWTVSRDMKDQNYMPAFRLECRRAEDGEVVWKLADLPEYAGYAPSGPPILEDGKLFVPVKIQQNQPLPEQWVLALRPEDGRLIWKTQVAVSRQGQPMYSYYNRPDQSPQVRLLLKSGALYVDTHVGLLARLDADSGMLDWGYGYETAPVETERYFFYGNQTQEPQAAGEPPREHGDALVFKGVQSSRIYAIDPNRMTVAWRRPFGKASRVLGADDRSIYLGGEELAALDAQTRTLSWATRLPGGSLQGSVLIGANGVWQATPRGVFELDPATGRVRRIFRGEDLGAETGDLILAGDRLLTISNRAITAYPRRPADAREASRPDPPANPPQEDPSR
ncbi:PQQ-binding-like beta-propeller repeat protein [Planctomyces sp. SH-PL62]|uniref:PQQ-binding-like beta-propeller repeat protein n=1 Tax=Planctomyces sp. SH-PL62 TaxID=1636152 RepID=UPI00078CB972|nr:PQQ-binding-like beta-propeller repeat protein [Planctomyces sp. SH-PL62]AMV41044.1 Outer membrane protein assembly factor BamB [Planctomyces sp. SH-PL62]